MKPQPRKFSTVPSRVPLIEWSQQTFTVRITINPSPKIERRISKQTNMTATTQTNQPDNGRGKLIPPDEARQFPAETKN